MRMYLHRSVKSSPAVQFIPVQRGGLAVRHRFLLTVLSNVKFVMVFLHQFSDFLYGHGTEKYDAGNTDCERYQ
jgi:hypothetical protein